MTTALILIAIFAAFLIVMHLWTRRLTRQGQETVPQLGKIIPVPGGSIHYVELGDPDAQTIVLIHGLAAQLQHFTYALADRLARDYHVIALDRPGCGYSTRDNAEIGRLPEQARMIDAFLEAKGVSGAVIVGHSLGGAVSLTLALDYPNRVAGLALLAPVTHPLPETPVIFRPLVIRANWLRNLIGYTVAVPMAAKTAPHALGIAFDPETPPDDFLDCAGGALTLRPTAFISASQDVIGAQDSIGPLCARYAELNIPGGILYGAQDTLLSPALHGASMTGFDLSYEEVPGLGHMLHITQPDLCAGFIRRMARLAAGSPPSVQETGQSGT